MTNGEKLKEVFPSIKLYEKSHDAIQINFDSVWWNAEYKEPTTKNDLGVDLISRADAIKAMQDKAKKLTNEDTINGLCGAVAILFDLPSITPQTRKGHWVHGEYCSECGCDVPAYIIDWKWQKDMDAKYCPNCGAKMKSEDKEC